MIAIVLLLLLLLVDDGTCNKRKDIDKDHKDHIAFVFAGSGRSVLYPSVYESLNRNLIRSFCPIDTCIGDVFVRVSHSDNTHDGPDSKGTFVEGTRVHRNLVLGAISGLRHSYYGKVIVDEVDIGSLTEKDQIEEEIKGTFRTKFYYQLDTRRFNMYFNRWRSYSTMLKNEHIMNITYKWVVHARLDMAFGTPVKPYYYWTQRVWVPDSWYADVPDTVALLPRLYSDGYFSLKDMYEPANVACIGGPNFSPNTTSPSALSKLGYNANEIKLIIADLCVTKNTADGLIVQDQKTGIKWSTAGNSEVQLKRKLKNLGIEYNRNHGKLGFTPFFTFWVRVPYNFICMYLDPIYFIPWVKEFQKSNSAILSGCQFMHESMPCNIDKLYNASHTKVKNTIGRLKCRDDLVPHDWNFMPYRFLKLQLQLQLILLLLPLLLLLLLIITNIYYRIKSKKVDEVCLSYNDTSAAKQATKASANIQACVETVRLFAEWDSIYHPLQLFHFYPLLKAAQTINVYVGERKKCLTYGKLVGNASAVYVNIAITNIHTNTNIR